SAAYRPAGDAGVPRSRPRGVPLSHLPDAPSAALRPRREARDGHPVRGKPRHGRDGSPHLRLAAAAAAGPAGDGGGSDPAHLSRALERTTPTRSAPQLDPPPPRPKRKT